MRERPDRLGGSTSMSIGGLATDGKGLFTTQSGHLICVTFDGKFRYGAQADGAYILKIPCK